MQKKNQNEKSQLPDKAGKFASRVEFIAIMDEIPSLIEKGYSYHAIHDFYVQKGVISMGYQTFCKYIRRFNSGEIHTSQKNTTNKAGVTEKIEKDTGGVKKPVILGGKKEIKSPADYNPEDVLPDSDD